MSSLVRLLRFTKNLAPYYAIVGASSVAVALAGIAGPFVIGSAADTIVHAVRSGWEGAAGKVVWLAAAFFAIDLLSTAAVSVGNYYGDVMSQKMRATLSSRYFRKLLALPQSYFDDELTGTITSRLNRSIAEATNFAKMFSNSLFTVLLTTVAVLVISAIYSPWLAVLLFLVFPVYLWLTMLTSKGWQVYERQKNEKTDRASGRFMEVIGQIKAVKSFVQELRELTSFASLFGETVTLTERQSRYWHTMDFIRRSFMGLMFFAVYAIIFVNTARLILGGRHGGARPARRNGPPANCEPELDRGHVSARRRGLPRLFRRHGEDERRPACRGRRDRRGRESRHPGQARAGVRCREAADRGRRRRRDRER